MKVFQILNNICYCDVTRQFPSLKSTIGRFSPEIIFAEAPDYVFPDWGYDPEKTGDERFIKPTAPEGWIYDDDTGTFYPENDTPAEHTQTAADEILNILLGGGFND